MTDITQEKRLLIEELGLSMEAQINVAPLAARVYALLVLSPSEGLTFDEIQEIIQASKSSISNNLKVLTQLDYVSYYTKPGIRKRFFKVAKYFQLVSLQKEIQSLEDQLEMIQKINAFNKKNYPEKIINNQSLGSILQDYLQAYQSLVKKTVKKIMSHQQKDKL